MARRPFDPRLAFGGLFPEEPDPPRAAPERAAPSESAPAAPAAPEAPAEARRERSAATASAPSAPAAAPAAPSGRSDLSVTAAAALVQAAIADHVPRPLRIVGQVSGLSRRTHAYFNLKDESSVIQCVLWKSRTACAPDLNEGDEVRATGAFDFWAKGGRTTFIVDRIEPRGLGSLEARYRALCEELRAKGWFDEERKPPLPLFPRRIAIITSRAGAALHDCLTQAAARCPTTAILVVDVPVQGEGAALEIARAIRRVDAVAKARGIDAILVTRGGGSREDLWAFNERIVAEAAYRCRTPLMAAIGHETDVEIIELVAHRAATPTRGIVQLLPDRRALLDQLAHWRARAGRAVQRRLAGERDRLASFARHALVRRPAEALLERPRTDLALRRRDLADAIARLMALHRDRLRAAERRVDRLVPRVRLGEARERIAQLRRRVAQAARHDQARRREALAALRRHLDGVSPERVLARGYSITMDADGRILRDAAVLRPGTRVRTRLARGAFTSETIDVAPPPRDG